MMPNKNKTRYRERVNSDSPGPVTLTNQSLVLIEEATRQFPITSLPNKMTENFLCVVIHRGPGSHGGEA